MSTQSPLDLFGLVSKSRSGARSIRGFEYQHWVAAAVIAESVLPSGRGALTPEGLDDASLDLVDRSVFLQAKSLAKGSFSQSRFLECLDDALAGQASREHLFPAAEIRLVLERSVAGTRHNLGRVALSDLDADANLRSRIDAAVSATDLPDLEKRIFVDIIPDPRSETLRFLRALAKERDESFAGVEIEATILADLVATTAASNSKTGELQAISATDVGTLLSHLRGLVSPARVEATAIGAVEPVDLNSAVESPAFYQGVDVVPGHVASGLVISRPDLTNQCVTALSEHRHLLIYGPSGLGKSALAWLTVKEAQLCEWFTVQRLNPQDVVAISRLAGDYARAGAAIGFVLDDVAGARFAASEFDDLISRLTQIPTTYVVGTIRTENMSLLNGAKKFAQVQPTLDRTFADRVAAEIADSVVQHVLTPKQAFEMSNGLLLEYVHLLTQGRRLLEVVEAQVDDRLRDTSRRTELEVLRIVATASAASVSIRRDLLGQILGLSQTELDQPLRRLVGEHLLSVDSLGNISGVHQRRSAALAESIHRLTSRGRAQTVVELLASLPVQAIVPLIVHEIDDHSAEPFVQALAGRMKGLGTGDLAEVFAESLTALRLAEIKQDVKNKVDAVGPEALPPTRIEFTLTLHEFGVDHFASLLGDNLDPKFAAAFARLDSVRPPKQLRRRLIELVGPRSLVEAILSCRDFDVLADLFAAADGMEDLLLTEPAWPPPTDCDLATRLWQSTPSEIARCLRSLRLLSPDAAMRLVPVDQTLAMLEHSLRDVPWVRHPEISADADAASDGPAIVRVDLLPIMLEEFPLADRTKSTTQEPLNAALVGLGRHLLDCLPSVGRVEVVAVSPAGRRLDSILEIGGSKSCRRKNFHPAEATKWNVARRRFAMEAIGVAPVTERLVMEEAAADAALTFLNEAVHGLVAGGRPNRRVIEESMQTVNSLSEAAGLMPTTGRGSSWLQDQSSDWAADERQDGDPIALSKEVVGAVLRLAKDLSGNLMPTASVLRKLADHLDSNERWNELGIAVPVAVARLAVAVDHLAIVAAGLGTSEVELPQIRSSARRVGTRKKLPTAARFIRERVTDKETAGLELLGNDLAASTPWSIAEVIQAGDGDPTAWSSDSLILVVECDSLLHWLASQETLSALARGAGLEHLTFVPMRNQLAIPQFSVAIRFGKASVVQSELPASSLSQPREAFTLASQFGSLVWGEILGSSVVNCHPHPYSLNPIEQRLRVGEHNAELGHQAGEDSELIQEVQNWLNEVQDRVEEESLRPAQDTDLQDSVADQLVVALLDPESSGPVGNAAITLSILLMEWEIDPVQAEADLEEILSSSN